MAEIKYDIRRGAGIYRAIFSSRLKNWISTGKIKREETLVWRSGLSGWRRPEELKELKLYFDQYEKSQFKKTPASLKTASRGGKEREKKERILPSQKIKNILIIDDEKDLCTLLSNTLRQKSYNVSSANTRKEGITRLKKERPNLVLLDLKLPDGDGMKIFSEIKKLPPKPIVIIISAYGSEEIKKNAKKEGVYAFIDKPFTEEDILRLIEKLNKPR